MVCKSRLFYCLLILSASLSVPPSPALADSVVVFNEIMYHPAADEDSLEWIELHNQTSIVMDISGWSIRGGIEYDFSEGTMIPPEGYLVVAIAPQMLETQTGDGSLGPFSGRLANSGEELLLLNNSDRIMDKVEYADGGSWPAAADGAGVSLAKFNEDQASGTSENWTSSEQLGGTPGAVNFPDNVRTNYTIAFNEVTSAAAQSFWVEFINGGDERVDLTGYILSCAGQIEGHYVFEEVSLDPGDYFVVDEAMLGFTPADEDKLFIYTPNYGAVVDAVVVKNSHRGRFPEADGGWLYPDSQTPGEVNHFSFHDEIVINEIMYRHHPVGEKPATYQNVTLLAAGVEAGTYVPSDDRIISTWTGGDEPFDDSEWTHGDGSVTGIGYETSPADYADLIGTNISEQMYRGNTSVYIRIRFRIDRPEDIDTLMLMMKYDDGFVAYINGTEVARANAPGQTGEPPAWDAAATASHSDSQAVAFQSFNITSYKSQIRAGDNILAVHGLNVSQTSSDMLILPVLESIQLLEVGNEFQESPEAWIELYNRSDISIDMTGWKLGGGIDYEFEAGTTIEPGAYLVVASDANELRAKYPQAPIVGDYERELSHKDDLIVLIDENRNPADEVHYFDSGYWDFYADGGGSSLELLDPYTDNSCAQAWSASDERDKGRWKRYTYRGIAGQYPGSNYPTVWNEFVFGLLDAGELLIDDVSVIEDPSGAAIELIRQGSFEDGMSSWRLLGNHAFGVIVPDPNDRTNHVLHLRATGATKHMHNHVETTLAQNRSIVDGREYEISFRARWLAGSNQLNTRLYFNRLARTTLLDMPEFTGTPGERNSRYKSNIGPTLKNLRHYPAVPQPREDVKVTVYADDPDGIQSVTLFWSTNGGPFITTPMEYIGENLYQAVIQRLAASFVVQFYVQANDSKMATSTYPSAGPDSRAMFQIDDGKARGAPFHDFRLIMTPDDTTWLHEETNLLSNHREGATVIYKEREVYYDVGARLKGSGYGRQIARAGYNLRFRPDQLFQGVHDIISVDRNLSQDSGRHRELVYKHIGNHAGGLPSVYDDMVYVIAPRSEMDGPAQLFLARFDNEYLDSAYQNGSDGDLFELEIIYYSTRTVDGNPESLKPRPNTVLDTDFGDMGDDKEAYRWNYLIKNHRTRDDYSDIMVMAKTFSLDGEQFADRIDEVIDVNQWMRFFAFQSLGAVADAYNVSHPHNLKLYIRPDDQRIVALPWDTDRAFSNSVSSSIYGSSGSRLQKVITIPAYERLFLWHLYDIINSTYNPDYMADWVSYYAEIAEQDAGSVILSCIEQRHDYVLSRLPGRVPFEITTNAGDVLIGRGNVVVHLQGTGWLDIADIRLAGSDDPLDVTWDDTTMWSVTFPLEDQAAEFTLNAYDRDGRLLASDSITVDTAQN